MTEEHYEVFLDEFGRRLQDAVESERRWVLPRRRTLLGGLTLCAAVAAGTLLLIAPWTGVPWSAPSNYLARAAVALAPPPGSVLYESWEYEAPSEGPGHPAYTVGPDQLWVEEAYPRHYRVILRPRSAQAAGEEESTPGAFTNPAKSYGVMIASGGFGEADGRIASAGLSGAPLEQGGVLEIPAAQQRPGKVLRSLTFVPPDELLSAQVQVTLGAVLPGPNDTIAPSGADPVSVLREALAEGRAREDGTTEIDGQRALRIEFAPVEPPASAPPLPANAPKPRPYYAYVDPETFYPVQIGSYHFLAYEYLSGTEANLALANIRDQHPGTPVILEGTRLRVPSNATPAY